MSYTLQRLQLGDNNKRVPGHEEDLILSNNPVPVDLKLFDPKKDGLDGLWGLVFSYESGAFYLPGDSIPGLSGATVKSWYAQGGPGPHMLSFSAFITGGADEGYIQTSKFVDFSETPTTDSSINTDTITHPTVTATVHSELPEYEKMEVSTHATSHSIIITSTTTRVVFDKIFVYLGSSMPVNNTITVAKNQTCLALAVFKKVTNSSSTEIGTHQWPRIPKWEWPMIVAEIVKDIMTEGKGEIYQHLSAKAIAESDSDTLKKAVSSINNRIEILNKIKSVVAGLAESKTK
jgi:hypothetical protein